MTSLAQATGPLNATGKLKALAGNFATNGDEETHSLGHLRPNSSPYDMQVTSSAHTAHCALILSNQLQEGPTGSAGVIESALIDGGDEVIYMHRKL